MESYKDYVDFIYLNTKLSKEEAKAYSVDCWNQGLTKYEAVQNVNNANAEPQTLTFMELLSMWPTITTKDELQNFKSNIDYNGWNHEISDKEWDMLYYLAEYFSF